MLKVNVVGYESDGKELKQEVEESTQPQRLDRLVDQTTLWLEMNKDKVFLDKDGALVWKDEDKKDEDRKDEDRESEIKGTEVSVERPLTFCFLYPLGLPIEEVSDFLNKNPLPLDVSEFDLNLCGQTGARESTTLVLRRPLSFKEDGLSLHSTGNYQSTSKHFSLKEEKNTFVLLVKNGMDRLVCILSDCQVSHISYEGWAMGRPEEVLTFQVGEIVPWFRLI